MERKNRYITTTILATILILSAMLQSNIIRISSSENEISQVSSITDPLDDLIYIYTGMMSEEYFDFVDVELVSLELSGVEPTLDCTITIRAGPPVGLENTVFYTLGFDENNNLEDNCMDYPYDDIDTKYTVIYTLEEWRIERAKYQVLGDWWTVEDTEASFGLASSFPGGFSIDMWIPLAELPELTETLPWRVVTDTFTYPSTFPDTGDFVPDEGLAYLGDQPPEPWIVEPMNSGLLYRITWDAIVVYEDIVPVTAVDLNMGQDIVSTLFEYSSDGAEWITIGIDETDAFEGFLLEDDENIKVGDEGWSIMWDISGLTEGTYYLRATMTDRAEQTGYDKKQIYYDPTPPILEIFEPFYGSTIKGVVEFYAKTLDEDVVITKLVHCNVQTDIYEQDNLGNEDQRNVGPNGDDGVNRYCAPTAAKNALHRLAQADPGLYPPGGGNLDMAKELAKKMGTCKNRGTRAIKSTGGNKYETDSVGPGLENYLKQRNRGCDNASGYTVTVYKTKYKRVEGRLVPESSDATWEAYERELRKGEAVILDVHTWDLGTDGKPGTDDDKVGGGHTLTGRSANALVNADGSHDCGFVNPNGGGDIDMKWRNETGFSAVEYPPGSGRKFLVNGIWVVSPKVPKCHPIGEDLTPEDGYMVEWDTTLESDGFYLVTATMVDEVGNSGSDVVLVYVNNHPTDIDNNGVVNIMDIATVAKAFGTEPGDEKWYPIADVNEDGKINILDIAMAAKDYGETY